MSGSAHFRRAGFPDNHNYRHAGSVRTHEDENHVFKDQNNSANNLSQGIYDRADRRSLRCPRAGRTAARPSQDPKVYGNFIEHLGRCIDGGIFEEGVPLSDEHGFRRDVLEAVKKLNVTILRWPGGNFVSNYHWKDGIGPRDKRPRRLEMAWGTVETKRFGTQEFMQYAQMLGTEPSRARGPMHSSGSSTLTHRKTRR
jgi:hypothetical protein